MNNADKIKEAKHILSMLEANEINHNEVNARIWCLYQDYTFDNVIGSTVYYNRRLLPNGTFCRSSYLLNENLNHKFVTSLDACMELLQKKVPFLERAGNSTKSISYLYAEYGVVRKTVSCNYAYFTFSLRAGVKGGFGCDLFYDLPFYRENSTKTGVTRTIGSHRFIAGGSTECLALLYAILKSYIHTWEQEDEST